jgi:hypothetical protein
VFCPVQQSGQPRVQAAAKDFKCLSDRFSAPTSDFLNLRQHHHRGTLMHKTLVLWNRDSVVVRVGTTLIGVQGSRKSDASPRHKSEHQPQCQQQCIYSGKAEPSCHSLFRERGNEASIRVPRMFKSHAWQQYDK